MHTLGRSPFEVFFGRSPNAVAIDQGSDDDEEELDLTWILDEAETDVGIT